MIKKIASVLLGILSASQTACASESSSASANDEVWMVYERKAPAGSRLVVSVRTGNADVAQMLHDGHLTAIVCRTDPANVNDQGMPQNTELLYSLEDRLAVEPALLAVRAMQVASVTGDGQRRMYFVHQDPVDFGPFLQSMPVSGFSCSVSAVADRRSLLDLITPTKLEAELNGDQSVIGNLQKNGDDGHAPRKTDFWFYGQKLALDSLVTSLQSQGFAVDHWLNDPTGVVVSRNMPVDFSTFQSTTPALLEAAENSGVEYDGWETIVVKPSS